MVLVHALVALRHFGNPARGGVYTWITLSSPNPSTGAAVSVLSAYPFDASILVVSFNTRELLRECLTSVLAECGRLPAGLTAEVLVVDNASADGSAEMVEREFSNTDAPVRLLRSAANLGFGAANNLALQAAQGRYPVLLNSDAFFHPGALARAIAHMDADLTVGIGAARQVSRDGAPQPSALRFHSIKRDTMLLTGLSTHFPNLRLLAALDWSAAGTDGGRLQRTMEVDWSPGAFLILRREALRKTGPFDPDFFLYYEEVDLCRRVKAAGYRILFWPDVVVTHIGGESSRQVKSRFFSQSAAQVVLWRMRSTLLYYRKHHGAQVWLARWMEQALYAVRWLRNVRSRVPGRPERARESLVLIGLLRQAWKETRGGKVSPPQPW
jgi:GT2 family glycosyltransferase